jgi:hypothetical protein
MSDGTSSAGFPTGPEQAQSDRDELSDYQSSLTPELVRDLQAIGAQVPGIARDINELLQMFDGLCVCLMKRGLLDAHSLSEELERRVAQRNRRETGSPMLMHVIRSLKERRDAENDDTLAAAMEVS